MSIKGKPAGQQPTALKNIAAAPIIYFDSVPLLGTYAGTIEVELAARALSPRADGGAVAEALCVAHLRCTPQAATELVAALDRALKALKRVREPDEGEAPRHA